MSDTSSARFDGPVGGPAADGEALVHVAGERLRLLPERAVFWPGQRTLFIADPHWGKAAAFRAGGIPVPGGTTSEGLRRLDAALDRTAARRIVFLGDYLHARSGRAVLTLRLLEDWAGRHPGVELVLVRGNHDVSAGDPPPSLGLTVIDPPHRMAPFVLTHHPTTFSTGYVLAGHLHPGVRLIGRGRQRERLPCFWFSTGTAVLPAFGDFTGLADIRPSPHDRIFVVANEAVVEVRHG